VPYVVFALVGLAVWTYVQMTITVSPQVLQANQQVVRRSPCPRLAFVTGTLISVLPPLAVVLVAAVAAAAISGHLGIEALAMPVLIVWLVVLMWGFTPAGHPPSAAASATRWHWRRWWCRPGSS